MATGLGLPPTTHTSCFHTVPEPLPCPEGSFLHDSRQSKSPGNQSAKHGLGGGRWGGGQRAQVHRPRCCCTHARGGHAGSRALRADPFKVGLGGERAGAQTRCTQRRPQGGRDGVSLVGRHTPFNGIVSISRCTPPPFESEQALPALRTEAAGESEQQQKRGRPASRVLAASLTSPESDKFNFRVPAARSSPNPRERSVCSKGREPRRC